MSEPSSRPSSSVDLAGSDPWSRRPGALPAAIILIISCVVLVGAGLNRPVVSDQVDAVVRVQALADMRLDVNQSSTAEFEALPLIGPALALRITTDRERHGSFHSIDDLQRVKGIGPRIVAIIEPHICVRPTPDG